jgi:peptide deformylase
MSIVHAGDPILRAPAALVREEQFGTPELLALIDRMVDEMRRAPGVGLAAPQLGIGLRILVMEDTADRMSHLTDEEREERKRSDVPLTAIVNPVLELAGEELAIHFEGCLSVPGYSALVPRAYEVVVSGKNPMGGAMRMRASGWPARILQHELDHLDGRLYVDRMITRSFATTEQSAQHYSGKSLEEIDRELGLELGIAIGPKG